MPIEVGSAFISIGADLSQLDDALNEVDKKLQSVDVSGFRKVMDEVENSISASIQPLEFMDASFVTLQNTLDSTESDSLDIMRAAFETTAYAAGDLASSSSDVMQQLQGMTVEAEKAVPPLAQTAEELKAIKEQADQMSAGLAGAGAAFTALAVVGVAAMRDLLNSAAEEQSVTSRLSATIKASGADWGAASGAIEAFTDSMVKQGFQDDTTMTALDRLTSVTGDYNKSLSYMPAIANLARAKSMDLSQAAFIVGRAMEGQVGILRRYGIVLKEGTTPMEAMAEIQRRFAGQTEAFSSTFAGANAKMAAEMDKLKDSLGARLIPMATQAVEWFTRLIERLNALPESTKTTIVQVLAVATAFAAVAGPALLIIGLLGKMQMAATTAGAITQLAVASGASVGPMGALSASFIKLAGSIGIAQAAILPILIGLAALAAASYLVYRAVMSQAAAQREATQAFEAQKLALSAQDLTQAEYVQGSIEAARVTGQLSDAMNYSAAHSGTYATAQQKLAEVTAQATREWLVQHGTVNIAAAGMKHWGESLELTGKEALVAGVNIQAVGPVITRVTDEASSGFKKMQEAVGPAFEAIQKTIAAHYENVRQAQASAQQADMMSNMDFNVAKAQLVAQGKTKELAALEVAHKQEQIKRDLNNKIAALQEQQKYKMELALQQQAMGKKLAAWVTEGVMGKTIKEGTGKLMLDAIKRAYGDEEIAGYEHMLELYKLSQQNVATDQWSTLTFITNVDNKIKALKEWTGATAAAAGGKPIDMSGIQGLIDAATQQLIDLGSGVGEAAGAAGGVTQTVGQVGQDIVNTVDSLLSSIQSVYEKLDAELPSYDIAAPLRRWMDKLVEMTAAMWEWAVGKGAGFGSLVRQINKDLLPDLKSWADVTGTIGSLLGNVASISEQLAAELPAQEHTVVQMLDGLLSITRTAGAWVRKNMGAGRVWQDIVGQVQSWAAPLEALGSVLKAFTDISATLATKTASAQFTVTNALDRLVAITREAGNWYRRNMGAGKVWADILVGMQSWADAMKPLLDIMNAYISTGEILAKKTEDARRTVSDIFKAVLLLLEEAAKFVKNTDEGKALEVAMRPFRGENSLTDFFNKLTEALGPLTTAINAATSLLDAASKSVPPATGSISNLFTALGAFVASLDTYLWAGGIATLFSIIQKLDTWGVLLTDLGLALKPLNDAFSVLKTALDIAGYKMPDVQLSVGKAFTALGAFVTSLDVYMREDHARHIAEIFSMIQKLSVWNPLLADLATALKPVSDAFGAMKTVFDLMAYKVPSAELSIHKALSSIRDLMIDVIGSLLMIEQGNYYLTLTHVMDEFEIHATPILTRLALVLAPLNSALSTLNAVAEATSNKFEFGPLGLYTVFDNIRNLMIDVIGALLMMEEGSEYLALSHVIDEFEIHAVPMLDRLATALAPLGSALSALNSVAEATSKKMPSAAALTTYMNAAMGALLIILTSFLAQIASPEWADIVLRLDAAAVILAQSIASAIQSIATMITSTMDAVSNLRVYRGGISADSLTAFEADLQTLITELMKIQEWWDRQTYIVGEAFTSSVNNLIQMAVGALGLFAQLGGVTFHVSQQKINEFGLRLSQLLQSLVLSFQAMSPEDLARINLLGETIGPALGAMGTALTVLTGLAGITMPDTTKMDKFITAMSTLIGKFATITITPEQESAIAASTPVLTAVGAMSQTFINVFKDMKDVPGNISDLMARMKEAIGNLMFWLTSQMAAHPDWAGVADWASGLGTGIQKLVDAVNSMRGLTPVSFDATAFFAPLDSLISGAKARADELGATGGVADQLRAAIAKLQAALAALGGGRGGGGWDWRHRGWHPPTGERYQHGGYIPSTGTYTLHAGEMVVPAAAAGSLLGLEHLAGSGAALGGGFMAMMVRSINSYIPDLDAALQQIADRMIPHSPIVSGPMEGYNPNGTDGGLEPGRPWTPPITGPGGIGPSWTWQANTRGMTIMPQISIEISGPVSAGSKKELNSLKRAVSDGIEEQMPHIVNQVSKAVTQQAKARARYGNVTG